MQDPFRPNSNAQLMREAQIGLIVIGLLLCVLVYVAFYRLTNRSTRFDEIARNVAVAEPVDGDPYRAHAIVKTEQKLEDRLEENKQSPLPTIEKSSSRVEKHTVGLRQSLADQNVAQATHVSPQTQSSGFVAKSAFTDQAPTGKTTSGFAASANRDSARTTSNSKPNEFLSTQFGDKVPKKSTQTLPSKKPQRIKPPVLKSEFGSSSSKDFLPNPTTKEKRIKNDTSSFRPTPKLPPKVVESAVAKVPPKPKQPVPEKVDEILKRQLAVASDKDQTSSFVPEPAAPKQQEEPQNSAFSQPQKTATIGQTSAVEPIEESPTDVLKSSDAFENPLNKTDQSYTTRAGDSLWTIAQAQYGDGRFFRALHRVNQDRLSSSESLPAGTSLTVPTIQELRRHYPELCPKEDKVNYRSQDLTDVPDTVPRRDEEPLEERFYVTEDGDTLFEIARQRFGQASRYLEIYELNRFRIPETANHLTPLGGGIELLLPK